MKRILIALVAGLATLGWASVGAFPQEKKDAEEPTAKEAFDAKIAELRKAGEPVKMAEAAPKEIPDAENAAVIYAEAWDRWEGLPEATRKRIDDITSEKVWTEKDLTEARDLLNEAEDVVDLLHGAMKRPECRYLIDYDVPGYAILLRHLNRTQNLGRLLAFSARVHLEEGKADTAVGDCAAALRLARGTQDEPLLISRLVEVAVSTRAVRSLEATMDNLDQSAEALAKVDAELKHFESRAPYVKCMKGERCGGIDAIEVGIKDPAGLMRVNGREPSFFDRLMPAAMRPTLYRDGVRYLDMMGRYIEAARNPWHQSKPDVERIVEDVEKDRGLFTGMLLPALGKAGIAYDAGSAKTTCARLGIVLRLYKMKHGAYPDALKALVPEFVDRLPVDPFSGTDYLYRRLGKGFAVYSVNENGADDYVEDTPEEGTNLDFIPYIMRGVRKPSDDAGKESTLPGPPAEECDESADERLQYWMWDETDDIIFRLSR